MRNFFNLRARITSTIGILAVLSLSTTGMATAVPNDESLVSDTEISVPEESEEVPQPDEKPDGEESASEESASEEAEGEELGDEEPGEGETEDIEDDVLDPEDGQDDALEGPNEADEEETEEVQTPGPANAARTLAEPGKMSPGRFNKAAGIGRGVSRAGGQDRYETSVAISKRLFPNGATAEKVFVAAGTSYSDGLTLGALAAYAGGPLLLTPTSKTNAKVMAEIKRLRPKVIYIAGGAGVVSGDIERQLKGIAPEVIRLGGRDRYDTSAAIAAQYPTGTPVMISTGSDYPDALVAGAASGKVGPSGAAVLLTSGFKSTSKLTATLKKLKPSSVNIVGGTWSGASQNQIKSAAGVGSLRIMSGKDRYDTSVKVAQNFWKTPSGKVLYATGTGYADSLTAVPAAKAYGAPLLLTKKDCRPPVLSSAASKQSQVLLIGGAGVITNGSATSVCVPLPPKVSLNSAGTYSFNMSHQAQINGSYCGPATATMIMSRLGYTRSVHGVPLSQSNIAGPRYLNTTLADGTRWRLASMSNGMNKWMGKNVYRQQPAPSRAQFQSAVANSVTKTGRPVVVDAQEYAGGPHYNSHPYNSTIDHLMPINSYNPRTGTITLLDSAAHFYWASKNEFGHNLGDFHKFTQRFGMYY